MLLLVGEDGAAMVLIVVGIDDNIAKNAESDIFTTAFLMIFIKR